MIPAAFPSMCHNHGTSSSAAIAASEMAVTRSWAAVGGCSESPTPAFARSRVIICRPPSSESSSLCCLGHEKASERLTATKLLGSLTLFCVRQISP